MATPKSLAEALADGVPALGNMSDWLRARRERLLAIAVEYPDSAEMVAAMVADIDDQLKLWDAIASPEALFSLGLTVMKGLLALPSTGLQPMPKPGSVTGG